MDDIQLAIFRRNPNKMASFTVKKTLATEYVDPLVEVGLADSNGDHYSATIFVTRAQK